MMVSWNGEKYLEDLGILRDFEQSYGSCDSEIDNNVNTYTAGNRSQRPSFWICLKASVQSTVFCGVLVGLFGSFLWWLELNIGTYCFTEWDKIPQGIHHRRLIVDIIIALITQFWVFACIAPLCGWSTIKELNIMYICVIGALLDAIDRLLLYIFFQYSSPWKHYIGSMIFLMTSCAVFNRFAWHHRATDNVHCNALVLTLKLNLQFIVGLLVSVPFNLVFLDLYYNSSSIERTILACVLIIAFAIPKLFVNHVVTNLHGICTAGDEIMLAVAYLTATSISSRLIQAKIEKLSYFIAISVVHGILNVIDKLSLPLRRRIVSCICCNRKKKGNQKPAFVNGSIFLANQTLISNITETTSVIFSSAAAYLLVYYYKREESTCQRYDGRFLLKEMVKRCSIAIGIEVIFNVIAVKIQTHLYKIPVIDMWIKKWKSIIVIHIFQVLFIVLYFSEYLNDVLLRDYYKQANVTCFGLFDRV